MTRKKTVSRKKSGGRRTSTPAKAQVGDYSVVVKTTHHDTFDEHDVVVKEGRKKSVVLDDEMDLIEAIETWEEHLEQGVVDYKSNIPSLNLSQNTPYILYSLRQIVDDFKRVKHHDIITAQHLTRELSKRLRIKEATDETISRIIFRLESEGYINVRYRPGLPMHGRGLDGDSNKRRMTIEIPDHGEWSKRDDT